MWCIGIDETAEQKQEHTEDEWVFHQESRTLLRRHNQERKGAFIPNDKKGCPVPVKFLQSTATVYQQFLDGGQKIQVKNWRREDHREGAEAFLEWVHRVQAQEERFNFKGFGSVGIRQRK